MDIINPISDLPTLQVTVTSTPKTLTELLGNSYNLFGNDASGKRKIKYLEVYAESDIRYSRNAGTTTDLSSTVGMVLAAGQTRIFEGSDVETLRFVSSGTALMDINVFSV